MQGEFFLPELREQKSRKFRRLRRCHRRGGAHLASQTPRRRSLTPCKPRFFTIFSLRFCISPNDISKSSRIFKRTIRCHMTGALRSTPRRLELWLLCSFSGQVLF